MADPVIFESFVEHLGEEVHDFSADTIKYCMTAAANPPSETSDTQKSDLTEVSAYTYLNTTTVTVTSWSQTSGVATLVLTDLTISASGGDSQPFRYVIIYNDDATNDELIGYIDVGSDYTILDGDNFKLDFDGTNGFVKLTITTN